MAINTEVLPSPLDATRAAMQSAATLDQMTQEAGFEESRQDEAYIVQEIHEIDGEHPLVGRYARLWGPVLPVVMGDEGFSLGAPRTDIDHFQTEAVSGVYMGLNLINLENPEGEPVQRVVHAVETGSSEIVNPVGAHVATTNFQYVCANSATIEAANCIDEHSLKDLAPFTGALRDIDALAFADTSSLIDTIRNVGKIANSFMNRNMDRSLRRQFVSYINSLGILSGSRLIARDFIVADDLFRSDSTLGHTQSMSDMSMAAVAYPHAFTVGMPYTRIKGASAIVEGDIPEMQVAATGYDGTSIIVPIGNIIEIAK